MRHIAVAIAFVLGLGIFAAISEAGEFGALAISPEGGWGSSYNYDDPEEARGRALSECEMHVPYCDVVAVFETVCVSVARNEVRGQPHITWAQGQTRDARARQALDECRYRGGSDCRILNEFCTGSVQDR